MTVICKRDTGRTYIVQYHAWNSKTRIFSWNPAAAEQLDRC